MPAQRIAVIGGTAAGPAAAVAAVRADPRAEVVLFEQGPHISYGACEIPYYVAGTIDEAERLVRLTPGRFEQTRGGTVRTRHRVLALDPARNRLTVEDLATGMVRQERFDKFILAVGARPRRPALDGLEAPNVFAVRTLEEAVDLRAYLDAHPVRHAVVLGGGYVGVEMAEALRARAVRVTILEPGPGVLHAYLDAALRPLVEDALRRHGVVVRRERAVGLDHHPDGMVRSVRTDRGEHIGCQLVLLAMGTEPNTDLAAAARLRLGETGALAVDAQMRTNLPNVWACGDCVEVERVVDRKKVYVPLSPTAFRTARVAGHNAARRGRGLPKQFPGIVGASAVKVFGLEVAAAGLRPDEAREAGFDAFTVTIRHWSHVPLYPEARPVHVQLVVERRRGRLLGAACVGEKGAALRADVLVPLIWDGWTVDRIRDLDLIYTPPLAPALDPLIVAANEAAKTVRP
ncbi:FAD-dependent oxidoreductase [Rhodocaloribacter litoris]|uniref:FAD-dependent oxidoreductase n=1 Tax=Rhodocaloribacter litoris TaxID=2558931 RepID=UPI001423BA31|nr:FAD-dependent oxidoreductase [Rhodocaloribacter litoris]QXD16120.1 FAD-dependent oxidoreductase [Rhodocaloribacter litoris]